MALRITVCPLRTLEATVARDRPDAIVTLLTVREWWRL
jgi:hypothetical protein